jgi:hypothetical protein
VLFRSVVSFIYGGAVWKTGTTVAIHQPLFYLMMVVIIGFVLCWKFFNHKIMGGDEPSDVTWLETAIHIVTGLAVNFVFYALFLYSFGGVKDTCLFNAKIISGTWQEHYTSIRTETVCDSHDKDGNCTSSHTVEHCDSYHPDCYEIFFSNGEQRGIDYSNYCALVSSFKNEKQVASLNLFQCSFGDGRKFETKFIPGKSQELAGCYEEYVINYVKGASHNIHKKSLKLAEGYKKILCPIPGIKEHRAGIGPFDSDRLIIAGVNVPGEWQKQTEEALDLMNGRIGQAKEVNVVLYVVNTSDHSFKQALEAYWCYGTKNQLTIIVGCSTFPKIDMVEVIDFWSNNVSNIEYDLRDTLQKTNLNDSNLVPIITKEVTKDWKRKRMRELEYLAREINMTPGASVVNILLILLLNIGFAIITKKFE